MAFLCTSVPPAYALRGMGIEAPAVKAGIEQRLRAGAEEPPLPKPDAATPAPNPSSAVPASSPAPQKQGFWTRRKFIWGAVALGVGYVAYRYFGGDNQPLPEGDVPPRGTILVFSPENDSNGVRSVLDRLRSVEGHRSVLYVTENGFPDSAVIRSARLDVAQTLTPEDLDNLIQVLRTRGEAAFEARPMGAALKGLLQDHFTRREEIISRYRADPGLAESLDEMQSNPTWEVDLYLSHRPQVSVLYGRPPLLAFLYHLRAEVSRRKAFEVLFRDGNERDYFRFLGDFRRFSGQADLAREQAYADLIRDRRAADSTPTLVAHIPAWNRETFTRALEGVEPTVFAVQETPLRFEVELEPHRALLAPGRVDAPPADARRVFLSHIIRDALTAYVRRGGLSGSASELDESIWRSLSGTDMDGFIRMVRERGRNLDPLIQQDQRTDWVYWVALYAVGWLNQRGELDPPMRFRLPVVVHDAAVADIDRFFQARLRAVRGAPPAPNAGVEEEDLRAPTPENTARVLDLLGLSISKDNSVRIISAAKQVRRWAQAEGALPEAVMGNRPALERALRNVAARYPNATAVRNASEALRALAEKAAVLQQPLEIAVHDHLLFSVQRNFGNIPGVIWRPISTNMEQATGQLEGFKAEEGVQRIAILDGMFLSEEQAAYLLPDRHPPAFLVDAQTAIRFTPEVAAALLRTPDIASNGIYTLTIDKEMDGTLNLRIQA